MSSTAGPYSGVMWELARLLQHLHTMSSEKRRAILSSLPQPRNEIVWTGKETRLVLQSEEIEEVPSTAYSQWILGIILASMQIAEMHSSFSMNKELLGLALGLSRLFPSRRTTTGSSVLQRQVILGSITYRCSLLMVISRIEPSSYRTTWCSIDSLNSQRLTVTPVWGNS